MASNEFSVDSSSDSEVSEIEDYEIEVEGLPNASDHADEETQEVYSYEPLADAEWLALYEQDRRKEEELEKTLQKRLNGTVEVQDWCQCENCNLRFLQNISECYCCCELEGCVEALTSDVVVQDLPEDAKLTCITQHPGFNPVCLEKWSLRLASHKYRTKGKKKYGQRGSEERLLRSVSYREFSRLVYGFLGNRRIPLPASAYAAIRETFPCDKDEDFIGFNLDEEDD
ncbi:uncharacterized protein LOC114951454 [Acropora millepora]|uniref:uncharacterized protein LOC114951454 n=1 Tax=Acropora millepora TaxID=45264 RepID=UPI001CF5BC7B|nr:uncharacterized protein LOC114951454 [Acropora millepora]